MGIEVLLSTMNIKNEDQYTELLKKMNIKTDSITINQCTNEDINELFSIPTGKNRIFSYREKGLSKSRNRAIQNANSDFCIIADDDLVYNDDYESLILDSYKKYCDADVIAFYVESVNKDRPTSTQKEKRIGYLSSMKIASFQITFRRQSIIDNNIVFNENFGAGSGKYKSGEENIFLFDCLKKKLKIYYIPIEIAKVHHEDSTWFGEKDELYFKTKGAVFYKMSKTFYPFFIMQFALRKYCLYKKDATFIKAVKNMYKGKKECKTNEY